MIELTSVSLFSSEGMHIFKSINPQIKPCENRVHFCLNVTGKTKLLHIMLVKKFRNGSLP